MLTAAEVAATFSTGASSYTSLTLIVTAVESVLSPASVAVTVTE